MKNRRVNVFWPKMVLALLKIFGKITTFSLSYKDQFLAWNLRCSYPKNIGETIIERQGLILTFEGSIHEGIFSQRFFFRGINPWWTKDQSYLQPRIFNFMSSRGYFPPCSPNTILLKSFVITESVVALFHAYIIRLIPYLR